MRTRPLEPEDEVLVGKKPGRVVRVAGWFLVQVRFEGEAQPEWVGLNRISLARG